MSVETQLLGCRVGQDEFCLDIAEVIGIQRAAQVMRESVGEDFSGRLAWRGGQIPVRRLGHLLGHGDDTPNIGGPILILSNGEEKTFGVQVDQVFRDGSDKGSLIMALPAAAYGHTKLCFGIARRNGKMAACLAAGQLYPDATLRWDMPRQTLREADIAVHTNLRPDRDPTRKLLCFDVGAVGQGVKTICGLSYSQVLEVAQGLHVAKVPGLDEARFLLGVTEWRGKPIAVVDVQRYLGLRHPSAGKEGLFAITRGVLTADIVAVPIRNVRTITLPISNPTLRSTPVEPGGSLKGSFVFDGGKLILPDLDPLCMR